MRLIFWLPCLVVALAAIWGAVTSYTHSQATPSTIEHIETRIVDLTNEARAAHGLPPLQHDPALTGIARAHSEAMIGHGYSHVVLGQDATDRALSAGYTCRAYNAEGSYTYGLAENIYQHPVRSPDELAASLVNGWMDSPGHRANILDPTSYKLGVGIAFADWPGDVYATQNFSPCP